MSECQFNTLGASLPIQLHANGHGRQQMMAQMSELLTPKWKTQIELLAPEFSLDHSQLLQTLGE